jgi:hypothetical protein
MTAEIVNLRLARKRKARAGREAAAAENRARYGQPKTERERSERQSAINAQRLAGLEREDRHED